MSEKREQSIMEFKGGFDVTPDMAHRILIASVIKQAVEDYQRCERRGLVRGGAFLEEDYQKFRGDVETYTARNGKKRYMCDGKKIGRGIRGAGDIVGIVRFIRRDMDELIDLAFLNVSGDAIRRKLGFPKQINATNPQ